MTLNAVIDLSHFNDVTDWPAVKAAGIVGVLHKATEGTAYVDPKYFDHRAQAQAAGLWWGAYHFGTADNADEQAEYFLSIVKPGANDLLVLDFEQNPAGASMTLAGAEQFVTHVQQITGRWPGFYSGSYIKQLLGAQQNTTLANCWFWLSEYGPTAHVPANWPTWTMWQYTDGNFGPPPHAVPGVGNCDRDQFNGDLDGLSRLWGYAAQASNPPPGGAV
jgi:lysozyme